MDADLRLAHDVQELFLTHIFPPSRGLEIDAKYIPSAQVGGDFYDFHQLSPHKFCLCIADVPAKEFPPVTMALCQTHLKHLVHKNRSPSEILVLLNEELFQGFVKICLLLFFLPY